MKKHLHGKRYMIARKSVGIARDKRRAKKISDGINAFVLFMNKELPRAINRTVITLIDFAESVAAAARAAQNTKPSFPKQD